MCGQVVRVKIMIILFSIVTDPLVHCAIVKEFVKDRNHRVFPALFLTSKMQDGYKYS